MFNSGVSLADIAAVTGRNNGDDGGFGGNNGWWVLIILFALFNRNGWGNENQGSGSTGGTYVPAEIQRGFDNQGVTNKLNGLENGLCSLGYDILSQTNGIQQSIANLGYTNQLIANQNQIADMNRDFAVQQQIAQCCCDQRADSAQTRYDMATLNCATNTLISNSTRDIIDNNTQGVNRILDYLCQEKISSLQAENQALKSDNSMAKWANYTINSVRPTPVPAWTVPNPNLPYGYNGGCCNNCGIA